MILICAADGCVHSVCLCTIVNNLSLLILLNASSNDEKIMLSIYVLCIVMYM